MSSDKKIKIYYGKETAEAMEKFSIGLPTDKIPLPIIKSFTVFKKACAMANKHYGLEEKISNAIAQACDDIVCGDFNNQFPLTIWQTISGTQTNVNVNEVISSRANEILGGIIETKTHVHPINHVNKNQCSNHTFSIAMNIAVVLELNHQLYPALENLKQILEKKSKDFSSTSQTYLRDAVPMSLGEEFSAQVQQNGA